MRTRAWADLMDMVATLLAQGTATHEIAPYVLKETNLSQVFLAFDLPSSDESVDALVDGIVESVKTATPAGNEKVRYPGERTLKVRAENMEQGIPVGPSVWEQVLAM
jgi:3-dehydro-L-gulonate 2-dehydrogenase